MTNYYAQETCTPSRTSLLTGRYPLTAGMQYNEINGDEAWGLDLTEILMPKVLGDLGDYVTYALGKWNLGHFSPVFLPTARGFDYFLGFLCGKSYYWSKLSSSFMNFHDITYV